MSVQFAKVNDVWLIILCEPVKLVNSKVQLVLPPNFSDCPSNKRLLREAGVLTKSKGKQLDPSLSETHFFPLLMGTSSLKGGSGLIWQAGPLLVTMQGLSGPAVLKLSAFGARVIQSLNYR